ncbi:MAG: hypothetical protein Kow00109_12960 [Acidobacteriota bacterium]
MKRRQFPFFMLGSLVLLAVICAVTPATAQVYDIRLSGAQQVPQNDSTATGRCLAGVSPDLGAMAVVCWHNVQNAQAAHIHRGAPDEIGPVVFPFDSVDSPFKGVFSLTAQDLADLQAGMFYVNIHSADFPGGEIRGQIGPPADRAVLFPLDGSQAVPPTDLGEEGICAAVLSPLGDNFALACGHQLADVAAAHIHRGVPGEAGPVVYGLQASTTLAAEVTAANVDDFPGFLDDFLSGRLYVNVHTPDHPDGAIRGQLPAPPYALYFPQFGNGGGVGAAQEGPAEGFTSSIVLVNQSTTTAVEGVLYFMDQDGMPLAVGLEGQGGVIPPGEPVSMVPFEIPPLGARVVTTNGQGPLVVGSAEVLSNGPVAGIVRFKIPGIGIAGFGSADPVQRAVAPVRIAGALRTAVAIRNNETYPITVSLELRDPDGTPSGLVGPGNNFAEVTIPANGRVAQFIDELFPQLEGQDFVGTLVIRAASGSFSAIALELGAQPGEFTSLPVTPLVGP